MSGEGDKVAGVEPKQVYSNSAPAQGWTSPPPAYSEVITGAVSPAPGVNVVHVLHPVVYGPVPVQTICHHCSSQVLSQREIVLNKIIPSDCDRDLH